MVQTRTHGTAVSGWLQQLVSRIGVPDHAPLPNAGLQPASAWLPADSRRRDVQRRRRLCPVVGARLTPQQCRAGRPSGSGFVDGAAARDALPRRAGSLATLECRGQPVLQSSDQPATTTAFSERTTANSWRIGGETQQRERQKEECGWPAHLASWSSRALSAGGSACNASMAAAAQEPS